MSDAKVIMLQEEPRGPSILIEVNVTQNNQQRIPFPDIAQLRSTVNQSIIMKGLRLISDEVLTNGVLSGNPTAPATELAKMTLVIYAEGWEKGQSIPVLVLNDMTFTTGAIPYRQNPTNFDNWRNVDWPKSYLQLANGTLTAGAPYTVLFECMYIRLDGQGNELIGAPR